ncbi:hypothetical protein E4U50_003467 [Claviceps purpurea]|nr:hypothetical protein E4U50_003467 [Claviceps purpurea]
MPSSPNQPEWLALYDPEGRHRGWIRRCDRLEIDEALTQAAYVYCRVEQRGRRWTRLDIRLDTFREWQESTVEWWTASEEEETWISMEWCQVDCVGGGGGLDPNGVIEIQASSSSDAVHHSIEIQASSSDAVHHSTVPSCHSLNVSSLLHI